ncbi:GH92 family glycosyl hydrolase [Prolixibacteraceae bacterium Z1-6]|uniref:GH92 family glycosyl hydrolase n=1 Tax=Draconibacterium aestuarii TaxID=2998507 RepID=A0A9X3F8R1_9BACT|nr:GH92 family glycosyl hydrolase [Prolixibacteraceae bacterium Z1-6]
MRYLILNILFVPILSFACSGEGKLKYVNPFIGTSQTLHPSNWEGHGRTYPGAVAPFGYIQLSPETSVGAWKGYEYKNQKIYFFSTFGHLSGYPDGSAGRCFVMPVENTKSFELRKTNRPFNHSDECAEPGYYKVKFADNGTMVETTASTRAGMFRFTFPKDVTPKIFIGDIGEFEFVTNSILNGSNRNVCLEFNTEWTSFEKQDGGLLLSFKNPITNTILLKLSSSSVSSENAKDNLYSEIPDWNFDRLKNNTQSDWEKHLSLIDVKKGSVQNKTKFYTALYHSLLFPWVVSDVNKEYKGGDNKIHIAKGTNHYGSFSPWDTFRSLHPLFCLIAPERQKDMIISILEIYEQTGQLPTDPMTGYHAIPIIVDSYFKNINDFDKSLAYRAMKESIMEEPFYYEDMTSYIQKGYVPMSFPESVTRTVEYAYNDWALSQYSKKVMNNSDDYSDLFERGLNYRNLFDPDQLFLVPRGEDGFVNSQGNFGFKEGDKWNYSLFVPHNIRDLINLKGGNIEFTTFLHNAIKSRKIMFDNEPNFHIPYLFNYANCPSKTQECIADIRTKYFSDIESGLPGNDDLGSMSSWFVFNALGFYPVCPGVPEYNIGTPLFEEVIIHYSNGNNFLLKASNVSNQNKYIQTTTLNGKDFNNSWLSHSTLISGGELRFVMDNIPSDWAKEQVQNPYSITQNEVDVIVKNISSKKNKVEPNELFWVNFELQNRGATGVKKVHLYANGIEVASTNVYVEKEELVVDSVGCRLYKPGIVEYNIKDSDKKAKVTVNESDIRKIEYSQLAYSPLIKDTAIQEVSFTVKNVGGKIDTPVVKLVLNSRLIKEESISLEPGESASLTYKFTQYELGINTVEVENLSGVFKVYNKNVLATLVDLGVQNKSEGVFTDKSGFLNHGKVRSKNPLQENDFGFDSTAYVEIENNSSFSALKNAITLMCWVKVSKANQNLSSIITQGDHNVIQLINNREIEFFAGGWGRGICLVGLPPDIIGTWHHIAGVCDGLTLKVYIDGELKGTAEVSNQVPLNTQANWNLGRNEEFPNKRIFDGKIESTKIFATPLSQNEIMKIISDEKNKF